MKACFEFILSDWRSILVGGAVIVGVVMFLVGCFKVSIGNRIKNKALRKTILSFLSLVLVFPITAAYILYNGWSWEYYWWMSGLFAVATIVIYHFYEGYHVREGLMWIGKNTVGKIICAIKGNPKEVDKVLSQVMLEINTDAKSVLKKNHRYKEDDLDKLL